MTSSCACGNVEVRIAKKPDYIYDCNCNLCRKSGGAWGYFLTADISVTGKTIPFERCDKPNPVVEIHSCYTCATTTHFVLTKNYKTKNPSVDQVGVNMRLFDPEHLQGVEIHYPNGKDWSGEGPFRFRREIMQITQNDPW